MFSRNQPLTKRALSEASVFKKEIQEQAKTLFEGKRGLTPIAGHREPELLFSEIGKLKVELDWLKESPGSARDDTSVGSTHRCHYQ